MKKNTYITRTIAAIAMVVAAACTNDDVEALLNEGGTTKAVDYYTVTVNLETAGTLAEELGSDYNTVEKLVVSGLFNAEDAITIRSLPYLEAIDMSGATIVGSSYTYDTGNGYQSTYTLQDNVIGASMFANMILSEIVLPESITGIGYAAFSGISGYGSLEIVVPEGVVSMESNAFSGCSNLTSVTLPSTLQIIPEFAFEDCSKLSNIILGENTTAIGYCAFWECSNLQQIELPESLIYIGSYCFYNSGLTSIVLPESIEMFADQIFSYCRSLTTVSILSKATSIASRMFTECSSLTSVTIPDNVTTIESAAFNNCSSLTSITIPDNVTTIGSGAFSGCSSLTSIKLPSQLSSIPSSLLSGCSSLTSIEIPASIREIESSAFSSCSALTEVVWNDSIREIGSSVFSGCSSLTSITLPARLRSLGDGCFSDAGLLSIEIPNRVANIGSDCFSGCDDLETVTIPENVDFVGENAFEDCVHLTSIYWDADADVPTLNTNPNCLLFLNNENAQVRDSNLKNIIRDGVAEELVLVPYEHYYDYNNRGYAFNAPQEFLAKSITYTLNFNDYTYPGESYGWQTIALPFTPTSIMHEDGRVVAPFNAGVEGAKPFWLRRMTSEGFANVTQLEAGVPYIIAMPNNSAYLDEYNLAGNITFSAEDENGITIPVTQTQVTTDQGPVFSMTSHFGYINGGEYSDIYRLSGGIFYRMSEWTYLGPFQCYATPNSSSTAASFAISSGTTTRSARPLGPVPSIDDM